MNKGEIFPASKPAEDVLVLVPFMSYETMWMDPVWRRLRAPWMFHYEKAFMDLEVFLERPLRADRLSFSDTSLRNVAFRSHAAIQLSTILNNAGIRWNTIDPGGITLSVWKNSLARKAVAPPPIIGISTTYVKNAIWLQSFFNLVRVLFPRSTIIAGGQFYTTSPKDFLSLNADVFFIGSAEDRLVDLVEAILSGKEPHSISGLFVKPSPLALRYTGDESPITFSQIPAPDWNLSKIIRPAIDPQTDAFFRGVQTQLGCAFRCNFCAARSMKNTYLGPRESVERILQVGEFSTQVVMLNDLIASHPKERWIEILKGLKNAGGSPSPLSVDIRLADISQQSVPLMSEAGIHGLVVGIESGSREILRRMNKGVDFEQLPSATQAIEKHGLYAEAGFIIGYPGENEHSFEETKNFIVSMNSACINSPAFFLAKMAIFEVQEGAAVSENSTLLEEGNPFGYQAPFGVSDAEKARFEIFLAMSKEPLAPASNILPTGLIKSLRHSFLTMPDERRRVFKWLKAAERGVAIFMEESLKGTPPSPTELRTVKDTLLANYRPSNDRNPAWFTLRRRIKGGVINALSRQWSEETPYRAKASSLLILAGQAAQVARRPSPVLRALLKGEPVYSHTGKKMENRLVASHARTISQTLKRRRDPNC